MEILQTNLLGRRVRVTRPARNTPRTPRALDYVGEVVVIAADGLIVAAECDIGVEGPAAGEFRWIGFDGDDGTRICLLPRDPASPAA